MCHTGGLEKFQNVPGIDIGQMRPRSSKFKYAMEELTKKVAPGFQSNKDINDRINGLSPDTKQCIKNSAQAMKQLEYGHFCSFPPKGKIGMDYIIDHLLIVLCF